MWKIHFSLKIFEIFPRYIRYQVTIWFKVFMVESPLVNAFNSKSMLLQLLQLITSWLQWDFSVLNLKKTSWIFHWYVFKRFLVLEGIPKSSVAKQEIISKSHTMYCKTIKSPFSLSQTKRPFGLLKSLKPIIQHYHHSQHHPHHQLQHQSHHFFHHQPHHH